MSIPVRNILSRKGWGAVSVAPDNTLIEAAGILAAHGIGAATVLDEHGALVGIVSERDVVRSMAEHLERIAALRVSDVMSRTLHTCDPDCTVVDAMQTMTTHRHRHLPILEDGKLLGMVSIGDLVKYRLEEADLFVEEMRAYVMQGDSYYSGHGAGQSAMR